MQCRAAIPCLESCVHPKPQARDSRRLHCLVSNQHLPTNHTNLLLLVPTATNARGMDRCQQFSRTPLRSCDQTKKNPARQTPARKRRDVGRTRGWSCLCDAHHTYQSVRKGDARELRSPPQPCSIQRSSSRVVWILHQPTARPHRRRGHHHITPRAVHRWSVIALGHLLCGRAGLPRSPSLRGAGMRLMRGWM